jgi:hypothetical protein
VTRTCPCIDGLDDRAATVSGPITALARAGGGHLKLRVRRVGHAAQHWGLHTHRAHAAHTDSVVAIFDGQPFGEPDGGVFGHAVGRCTELGQQAGGRGDGGEMSTGTLKPFRHNSFGCADMGAHVDGDDRSQAASSSPRPDWPAIPALAR